jgi:putative NIF3 family GTP cyclohydrolase 1 type 2
MGIATDGLGVLFGDGREHVFRLELWRMITAREIHRWLEERVGRALHEDEGVMFGDPNREVTGVSVCWMASPENMERAAAAGHELLIHHEALLYPYPFDHRQPLSAMHWYTNSQRLATLGKFNLMASRLHGTIDELWIFEDFAAQLGLKKVIAEGKAYHDRVWEIEPTPYGELIERVKRATGMKAVRATSVNPGRIVRKVGMPWGGLGLFVNVNYVQGLLELERGIDVMIAGETDNYGFRFCTELGIDVIETSHEVSENGGLRKFADAMRERFGGLRVEFIEERIVWGVR